MGRARVSWADDFGWVRCLAPAMTIEVLEICMLKFEFLFNLGADVGELVSLGPCPLGCLAFTGRGQTCHIAGRS
jgi:hypothetical protein